MNLKQLRVLIKGLPGDTIIFFSEDGENLTEACSKNVDFTEVEDDEEVVPALIFGPCVCEPEELPVIPQLNQNLN